MVIEESGYIPPRSRKLNFETACRDVLGFLREQFESTLWLVTRIKGGEWTVLQVSDRACDHAIGSVLARSQTPGAARCGEIPGYAAAALSSRLRMGDFVGLPVLEKDGSLFGMLCGLGPGLRPPAVSAELPLLELLGGLLSALLQADLEAAEQSRRIERAEADSMRDSLTGLYNRRGWDHLMAAEETRCARYGHAACVLVIDLNGLKQLNDLAGHLMGDGYLRSAAEAIRGAVRQQDLVARVGGDEFTVLGVECDEAGAESLQTRVNDALEIAGVSASLGRAQRRTVSDLVAAQGEADQAMYLRKRELRRPCPN